jgi:hypothetical protein
VRPPVQSASVKLPIRCARPAPVLFSPSSLHTSRLATQYGTGAGLALFHPARFPSRLRFASALAGPARVNKPVCLLLPLFGCVVVRAFQSLRRGPTRTRFGSETRHGTADHGSRGHTIRFRLCVFLGGTAFPPRACVVASVTCALGRNGLSKMRAKKKRAPIHGITPARLPPQPKSGLVFFSSHISPKPLWSGFLFLSNLHSCA